MLLKDLPIGTRVVDNDTKYLGEPIVWLVADKNHKGYPNNSVTLLSEKILCRKCFDAPEKKSASTGVIAADNGNGVYYVSNINSWLNSASHYWYYKTHSADTPPGPENFNSDYDKKYSYENESGFLTNFSSGLSRSLLPTSLTTIDFTRHIQEGNNQYYEKPLIRMSASVFLPSEVEINDRYWAYMADDRIHNNYDDHDHYKHQCNNDEILQIFKKYNYQFKETIVSKAFVNWATSKGISHTTYCKSDYWTRSSYSQESYGNYNYYNTSMRRTYAKLICGIRPVCNVTEKIEIFDKPDSNGVYTMKWNQPPNRPEYIKIPDRIRAGKPATISWGTATDPDGENVVYGLDRKVDNNNWSRIYRGADKEYTDNIVKGWNTVGYRVAAYDGYGAGSGYVVSETKQVINNADPEIITDINSNLGLKTGPFDIIYTIMNEEEEQSLTVNKYFDGKLIMKCKARRGQEIKDSITEYDWQMILNGEHKFKIEVRDSEGGTAEKVFTFSKNETSILLELKKPLEADDRVTKAIINVGRVIPDGAEMRIEVCNNAFDDKPTWQDVTRAVLNNSKIFIANETKTADKWGVNIRVAVDRNNATGDCFISSIGGVFE